MSPACREIGRGNHLDTFERAKSNQRTDNGDDRIVDIRGGRSALSHLTLTEMGLAGPSWIGLPLLDALCDGPCDLYPRLGIEFREDMRNV
jgi:hypothetical protein